MRIECPNCGSKYEVDKALFPEEGREVQCSNCETTWLQTPVDDPAPMRLATPAAARQTMGADGRKPSQQLSSTERDRLRAQAQQEVALRDRGGRPPVAADADEELREEDIIASLRAQIDAEGGGFDDGGDNAKSQKRNLRKAAEAAGIDVVSQEEPRRRWDFASDAEEDEATNTPARSKLAQALKDYEEVAERERGTAGRWGFAAGILVCLIGAAVYVAHEDVAEAYPPAAPYLDSYAAMVDQTRDQVEALYAQHGLPLVRRLGDMVGGAAEDSAEG